MSVLGKCWNSGNTVIGLAIGIIYKLRNGKNCTVRMGHNAVEFCGCQLFPQQALGVTFGNVVLYRVQTPPEWLVRHEEAHTRQGEVLGPLYLPLHLLALVIFPPERNPLEFGPHANPPRPW